MKLIIFALLIINLSKFGIIPGDDPNFVGILKVSYLILTDNNNPEFENLTDERKFFGFRRIGAGRTEPYL